MKVGHGVIGSGEKGEWHRDNISRGEKNGDKKRLVTPKATPLSRYFRSSKKGYKIMFIKKREADEGGKSLVRTIEILRHEKNRERGRGGE